MKCASCQKPQKEWWTIEATFSAVNGKAMKTLFCSACFGELSLMAPTLDEFFQRFQEDLESQAGIEPALNPG